METIKNKTSSNCFAFDVDEVEICTRCPKLTTAEKIIQDRIGIKEKLEDYSHRISSQEAKFIDGRMPGFILAVHTAYQNHYALKLSVTDFIILIGQGLSQHIEANFDKLRHYFVNHEGKERIKVHRDDFIKGQQNDWSTLFEDFAEEIKKRVKSDIYEVIIDDTSVATPTTRIVSQITLMEAMKSYFDYQVISECRIPQITLEGVPEDWKKLQEKVAKLVEMNKDDRLELKWWLVPLKSIISRICGTAINREADVEFWQEIYKYHDGSGGASISGWITFLFPYLKMGRNKFQERSMTTDQIPKQISEVPFIWQYLGEEIPMKFHGGFMEAEYDKEKFLVKPAYFWSVS